MYKIIGRDAYDLSETEFEVEQVEDYEEARLRLKELEYENNALVSEMQDSGYTTFYHIEEV